MLRQDLLNAGIEAEDDEGRVVDDGLQDALSFGRMVALSAIRPGSWSGLSA